MNNLDYYGPVIQTQVQQLKFRAVVLRLNRRVSPLGWAACSGLKFNFCVSPQTDIHIDHNTSATACTDVARTCLRWVGTHGALSGVLEYLSSVFSVSAFCSLLIFRDFQPDCGTHRIKQRRKDKRNLDYTLLCNAYVLNERIFSP
jgi:hypothetical protein